MKNALTVLLIVFTLLCHGEDVALAEALTKSGAVHASKGNYDQAKDLLYRALAHNENCGNALFELAKIEDLHGDKNLSKDLYERSFHLLVDLQKIEDCEKKLRIMHSSVVRISDAVSEYNKDVVSVFKRYPDMLTTELAINRVEMIKSMNVIPEPRIINVFDPKILIIGYWQMSDTAKLQFRPDGVAKFYAQGHEVPGKWELINSEIVVTMSWVNKYKFTSFNSISATNCQLTGTKIEKPINARK